MKKTKDNPMKRWTKYTNIPFPKEKILVSVRYVAKYAASALNSEMQIDK